MSEKINITLKVFGIFILVLLSIFFLMMFSNRKLSKSSTSDENVAKLGAKAAEVKKDIPLEDIIAKARSWEATFESWRGKTAGDFEFNDINGTSHRLSDYRGRNVLLVFWATWCGPCRNEIPHLMALRNSIAKDKLAIVAISNEDKSVIKDFAVNNKINYTVSSLYTSQLGQPYSLVNSIPCSFFIDPEGKIKLATVGAVNITEMKAILDAKVY